MNQPPEDGPPAPTGLADAGALPRIPTERLLLRHVEPADAAGLFEVFGDPEVCRYTSIAVLPDLAAARAFQEEIQAHFEARTLFQWALVTRADEALVGTCTLAELSAAHRRAELGFALGRDHWGRGYITEALPPLLDFAFGPLGLHRLVADVDPRNTASRRALERLGFVREGRLRQHYRQEGEWQDGILYGLLRYEWTSRTDALSPAPHPKPGAR